MEIDFSEVVQFHGHVCPGLAIGFRVGQVALSEMSFDRSGDEELVAIVENNSCAVDAVQFITGCTFGKGNLLFNDYGKQVYTFIKRSNAEALRLAVIWQAPPESPEVADTWKKYRNGDRSAVVMKGLAKAKARKASMVLAADPDQLFSLTRPQITLPPKALIHPSHICVSCGEKVMETRIHKGEGGLMHCIPCSQILEASS